MWLHQRREWADPLRYAAGVPAEEPCWALFYSGLRTVEGGRYSLLALDRRQEVRGEKWEALEAELSHAAPWYEHAWFGYLGYGLKNRLERLPEDRRDEGVSPASGLPDLWMVRFGLIMRFDHETQMVEIWAEDAAALQKCPQPVSAHSVTVPHVGALFSPMSKAAYLEKVARAVEEIHRGRLYQANITRKFTGMFASPANGLGIFERLAEVSPAPYSAYVKYGEVEILSSSPEQFIRVDSDGLVEARPIKGTAPRQPDSQADAASREGLRASPKDKAENLMIVDLMRNDLARMCEPGSVGVDELFAIRSYATVHHMVSRIYGRKKAEASAVEVVKACFPPGSMTGAPKISAMKLCSELEELRRGVYAGAIGWFGGDGSCDFSVVIRTLVKVRERFEFQVGGGIVADSLPESEWEETLVKARGVLAALGLDAECLRSL